MSSERKPNILIVDDVAENIQIVASTLQREGYDMSFATSGKAALESVAQDAFDLVLLDVMMPEMNGFEVCEQLRANPRTANLPVIFLTAKTDAESIVRGFAVGGVDYVTKPFNASELNARVRTHLRLRRTEQELRELNDSKDKFISIIAHDLRIPFSGLSGILKLLSRDPDSLSREELLEYLGLAQESADNINHLLTNLLSWSGLMQGMVSFRPYDFLLKPVFDDVTFLFRNDAAAKSIRFETGGAEGVWVFGDLEMLESVLRNLVSNAIKFSHANQVIQISASTSGAEVTVCVADQGIGIDPELQVEIFSLGSKLKETGTEGEMGTGMGLILSREQVERNGGRIWLESRPEEGTKVYFTLPIGKDSSE